MYEQTLSDTFKRIFQIKKVTYDKPSDSQEQECLFIEVKESRNTIKDGSQKAVVTGEAIMYAQSDKIPFGFFSKKIAQASFNDTKDLFFHEIEVNTKTYQNIVARGFSFVYFFNGQYDPNLGNITSVELEET